MAEKPIQPFRVQVPQKSQDVPQYSTIDAARAEAFGSVAQDVGVAEGLGQTFETITDPPEMAANIFVDEFSVSHPFNQDIATLGWFEPSMDYLDVGDRPKPEFSNHLRRSRRLRRRKLLLKISALASKAPALAKKALWQLRMPLIWLVLLVGCGGTGWLAFLLLTGLPPATNCERLSVLASDSEKLQCTEQAAQSGKLDAALGGLKLVKDWAADHPLHNRAKPLTDRWSKTVLIAASEKARKNDLAGAIALAQEVPASSAFYKQTQAKLASWRVGQNRGQKIEATIETTLKTQKWQSAEQQIQLLAKVGGEHGQQRAKYFSQRLVTEKTAWQQLVEVQQRSAEAESNAETLGKLLAIAKKIDPNTYAHPAAEVEAKRLLQALNGIVTAKLAQSDTAGAIATAQWLPPGAPIPVALRDALWVHRAQPLLAGGLPDQSLQEEFWQVWTTLSHLRQIAASSPLYAKAQGLITQLETQTRDLTQLQLATTAAQLNQAPALQIAINLAKGVAPKHPERIYAQTLIAQWNQQLQILEDQPIFKQAQALAQSGKLVQAVQMAAKIRPGRVMYKPVQTSVQRWTNLIQLSEDQPILAKAKQLASQGNLTEAINIANQIAADRALYSEAQAEVARWTAQREIALAAAKKSESGNRRSPQPEEPASQSSRRYNPPPRSEEEPPAPRPSKTTPSESPPELPPP